MQDRRRMLQLAVFADSGRLAVAVGFRAVDAEGGRSTLSTFVRAFASGQSVGDFEPPGSAAQEVARLCEFLARQLRS